MKITVNASQWLMVDENGNDTDDLEAPTIYIDGDGEQLAELGLGEAISLVNSLLLVILEAREWTEGYYPISGMTENFVYALRSTTTHTGGVYAQD